MSRTEVVISPATVWTLFSTVIRNENTTFLLPEPSVPDEITDEEGVFLGSLRAVRRPDCAGITDTQLVIDAAASAKGEV